MLMLVAMLVRDLMIGLSVLIAKVTMQLGMLVGTETLIMGVAMRLIQLIVDIGVLPVKLIVLSTMRTRRMGECRTRCGECGHTEESYEESTHVHAPFTELRFSE